MTMYTVAMATYYTQAWHIDYSTESDHMNEHNVIACGRELAACGAFPLYTEYVNGQQTHIMIEYNGRLELAFGMN